MANFQRYAAIRLKAVHACLNVLTILSSEMNNLLAFVQ